MLDAQMIELILQRVASTAISPSAAQHQGPPKTMVNAVRFLFRPALIEGFSQVSAESFLPMLDAQTVLLQQALPVNEDHNDWRKGGHWGTARKFMNIFLYECTLSRYLCRHYEGLADIEPWLEVPLDSYVGCGLAGEQENGRNEQRVYWDTIIGLNKERSDAFQRLAQEVAHRMSICRVHLDLYYLRFAPEAQ